MIYLLFGIALGIIITSASIHLDRWLERRAFRNWLKNRNERSIFFQGYAGSTPRDRFLYE